MPDEKKAEVKVNPNTELRAIITELSTGELDIQYQAYVAGTEIVMDLRPTHIAGMLQGGAHLVMQKQYKHFKVEDPLAKGKEEGNSKKRKK